MTDQQAASTGETSSYAYYKNCMASLFGGAPLIHVIAADDLGMTPSNSNKRPFRAAALAFASTLACAQPALAQDTVEDPEHIARMMLTVAQMEQTYLEDFQAVLPSMQVNMDRSPATVAMMTYAGHYDQTDTVTPLSVEGGDRSCTVMSSAFDKTMNEVQKAGGRPIDLSEVGKGTRDALAESIYGCMKQASQLIGNRAEPDLPDYIANFDEYNELGINDIETAIGGAYLLRTVFPAKDYQGLKTGESDVFSTIAVGMSDALADRMLDNTYAGGLGPDAWQDIVEASRNIAIALAYPIKHGVDMTGLELDRVAMAITGNPIAIQDSKKLAMLIETARFDIDIPHDIAQTALGEFNNGIDEISAAELYGSSLDFSSNDDIPLKRVANSSISDPDF